MSHTTNLVAAAAAVTTVLILIGAAPAEGQHLTRVRLCGLEFARAVYNHCSRASKRSDPGTISDIPLADRYLARDTGYGQVQDTPFEWYDLAGQAEERLRPSLSDIIFAPRYRRSLFARPNTPMGRHCCVTGCTSQELASVC
ncbi:uncharacterized protein LOC121406357 [Lytechinus variegatus]|uniref:uncharacterized protein LOC121406357 n=1 Tax=Lytechinus variegatus TaxID=7654 RepID=UPI001BB12962|nr:uncharacterized protein LOC121406357 [Lytechinus variegatus]